MRGAIDVHSLHGVFLHFAGSCRVAGSGSSRDDAALLRLVHRANAPWYRGAQCQQGTGIAHKKITKESLIRGLALHGVPASGDAKTSRSQIRAEFMLVPRIDPLDRGPSNEFYLCSDTWVSAQARAGGATAIGAPGVGLSYRPNPVALWLMNHAPLKSSAPTTCWVPKGVQTLPFTHRFGRINPSAVASHSLSFSSQARAHRERHKCNYSF